jgi:hypothetical protein
MRLLPLLLLGLPVVLACGGSGSDPTKTYNVAATNKNETGNPGQDRVVTFTLTVTDDNGQVVSGNAIILQLSVGTAVPNNPVTNVAGQAAITWTILAADQTAGRLEGLAFCAPGAGESFCKTNLSGPNKVTAQF